MRDIKLPQIKVNDKTVTALPFWQLLDAAGLVGDDAMIYLSAPDGIISGIPASELKADCYLYMGSENGWQFVSEKLPPQCGVKRMDKIVVCAKTLKNEQRCLRIIADDQYLTLSYGELFMADADAFAVHEADPKKYDATVSVNTRRSLIPISAYAAQLHKTGASKVLAYFETAARRKSVSPVTSSGAGPPATISGRIKSPARPTSSGFGSTRRRSPSRT